VRWLLLAGALLGGAVLAVASGSVALLGEDPQQPVQGVATPEWVVLTAGLEWGSFLPPEPALAGDSRVRVARVDPEVLELVLLNATATEDGLPRTARDWAEREGLYAAINASMYATDHLTSIHLMRTRDHVNNRRLGRDKAVLAFDPTVPGLDAARILDRECGGYEALSEGYGTLVQSIRMLGCQGENVWAPRDERWSHAVIGQDRSGRILLIHARSPWSTHEFIDILRALPLDLVRLQYAEGGPPAQLFVQAGGTATEVVGMSRTPGDESWRAVAIPNVIGVRPRAAAP